MRDELIASGALELHEADALERFHASAHGPAARALGVATHRLGSARLLCASDLDILAYNRVVGLGVGSTVDDEMLETVIEWYRDAAVKRFFIQLSPPVATPDLVGRLAQRGFTHHNNWVKLYRDASPPLETHTDLRIEKVGPEQANAFGEIFVEAFDHTPDMIPWLAGLVGQEGWMHYIAFDGDLPVATAAMYLANGMSWFDFAATLDVARGRGAQSALIARRIEESADLGCHSLIVETAEVTTANPAPSYRNVARFGFEAAYTRPNYILVL
jgi:hypothetical protein